MRQQTINMPADERSGPVIQSRGTGIDVIAQLVAAALVLAVAIWFFGLPN